MQDAMPCPPPRIRRATALPADEGFRARQGDRRETPDRCRLGAPCVRPRPRRRRFYQRPLPDPLRVGQAQLPEQPLPRLPAVERVAVMRQQVREVGIAVRVIEDDWHREVAQQRGHRCSGDVFEDEGLLGFGELHYNGLP